MEYPTSSFSENLRRYAPELLPGSDFGNATAHGQDIAPHGTNPATTYPPDADATVIALESGA